MKPHKITQLHQLFLKTIDKIIHLAHAPKSDSAAIKKNLTQALYLHFIHQLDEDKSLKPILQPLKKNSSPSAQKVQATINHLKLKLQKNPHILTTAFKHSCSAILHDFVSKLKPQLTLQATKQLKQAVNQNFSSLTAG